MSRSESGNQKPARFYISGHLTFTKTWLHRGGNKGPERPSVPPKITQPVSPGTYMVPDFLTRPDNLPRVFLHQENSVCDEHPLVP